MIASAGHVSHGPAVAVSHGAPEAAIVVGQAQFAGGHHAAVIGGHQTAQAGPRIHEIHTHGSRQLIRVEEYARPNQVIRVHEAPSSAPEIIKVKGPAPPQSLIRVVAKGGGRAHVERIVHRARGVQVINVQKPASPPARIVHVIREQAPAPRVEFVHEPEGPNQVYVAQSPAAAEVVLAPSNGGSAGGFVAGGHGGAFNGGGFNGGAILAAAPIAAEPIIAAPIQSAPISYAHAPQAATFVRHESFSAAPAAVSYNEGSSGIPIKTKILKYHH